MIKEIVTDQFLLSRTAAKATNDDGQVASDLYDTLSYYYFEKGTCVGMAANMIGVNKAVIAFVDNEKIQIMYNPIIMKEEGKYATKESCLSHPHEEAKDTFRYKKIKVSYFDEYFKKKIKTYTGFTAQIIQHEMDHLEGVLI